MKNQLFESNSTVYTVRLLWDVGQPFVCGSLEEVVKYSLKENNGIDYFAEITNLGFKKLSKKYLKTILGVRGLNELSKSLFSIY